MDIISQNIKGSNIRASTNNLEAVKRVLMKFQLYTKTNIIYKKWSIFQTKKNKI